MNKRFAYILLGCALLAALSCNRGNPAPNKRAGQTRKPERGRAGFCAMLAAPF